MKNNRNLLTADLSFLGMLFLIFIGILFLAGNTAEFQRNCIILAIAIGTVIVTYFTSLTTGLVLNVVLIFTYVTAVIVMAAGNGSSITSSTYFWILWMPAMTVTTHLFSRRSTRAAAENEELRLQLSLLTDIDPETGLKNMRSFERECSVYIKIAHRYQMDLVLVIWEMRYQREFTQILGEEKMDRLVVQISKAITSSLREEDAVYLLNKSPYSWGTLLFTNPESTNLVVERVRTKIQESNMTDVSGRHAILTEMRVGHAVYSPEVDSPMVFLQSALKQTEYDV